MAKAALTEGTTKSNIKTSTTTKKPGPPPAPTKKAVAKKVTAPEVVAPPAKVTRAKKATPVVSALFEEPAPIKKPVAKKVTAPETALTKKPVAKKAVRVEPSVAVPVKTKASAPKITKDVTPSVIAPEVDNEISAGKAGLLVAPSLSYSMPKKVMTKEEIDIDLSWARLFNAYLKRDLKQASEVVASLTKLLSKK